MSPRIVTRNKHGNSEVKVLDDKERTMKKKSNRGVQVVNIPHEFFFLNILPITESVSHVALPVCQFAIFFMFQWANVCWILRTVIIKHLQWRKRIACTVQTITIHTLTQTHRIICIHTYTKYRHNTYTEHIRWLIEQYSSHSYGAW